MIIRHSNLLAQAHFLRTKAEPNIVCRPLNALSAAIADSATSFTSHGS